MQVLNQPYDPGVDVESIWEVGDRIVADTTLGFDPYPVSAAGQEAVAATV